MKNSEVAEALRALEVKTPSSSEQSEARSRERLLMALEAQGREMEPKVQAILESAPWEDVGITLGQEQAERLAGLLGAHATPLRAPATSPRRLESHEVLEDGLRALVGSPAPLRSETHHVDSLEFAARILRAEELLEEVRVLIEPTLNNRDERAALEGVDARYRKIIRDLWPSSLDDAAEPPGSKRRSEWLAALVDTIEHHLGPAAEQQGKAPLNKASIAKVASKAAELLGIDSPPSAESLAKR